MLLSHVPSYFKTRRDKLMQKAAQSNPQGGPISGSSAFIIPAAIEYLRNNDVHHAFRQDSNFYYLSGFDEPESFLVLVPAATTGNYRTVLFVRKRDPEKEMWEGERYGTEGAMKVFGADEAYTIDQFDKVMPDLLKGTSQIYYRIGQDEATDRRVLQAIETYRKSMGRSGRGLPPLRDPNEILGEMRLFKSKEEADLLRKACQITAQAHTQAMREVRPGMNEFEVEALIDYQFRKNGCQRLGYGSIVAGGKNAACLHYRHNNEDLNDGELLLIDAGGEFGYYTSDITRTFPIGRSFSTAQAKLYDLVLKSQLEAIELAKPGATIPAIHRHVCEVLTEGLLSLGLLKGKKDEIMKSGEFRRFFPHGTSHWLGMDVHDAGLYLINGEPRVLEAGMVFTIEPGLYTQPTDREVPEEYKNIGIRIEDDVLITEKGCEVLTKDVPKTREDILKLRQ